MKIVYIVDFAIPSKSASSVHVMKMCDAFAQEGHSVTLVCLSNSDFKDSAVFSQYDVKPAFSIRPVQVPNIKGRLFLFAVRANRIIRACKPDLVYSRSILSSLLPAREFPIIVEAHRPVWEYGRTYDWIFAQIVKSKGFRKLVVISEALRKIFEHRYSHVPMIVAHDAASEGACHDANVRLANQGWTWNAGYVGNIYPGRGIDILVELARRMPSVGFHLVGGDEKDLDKIGIRDVPANVFCYGHVPHVQVKCFRSQFDVLLAPYQDDTETIGGSKTKDYMSPLKIFEYMSEKKVIIASDFPVLREVLNESNALLVAPAKVEEWEAAVKKSMDKENAALLASNAYRDFQQHYTWRARACKVIL